MKAEQAATKHAKLCDEIRRHDRLYYVDGAPEIEDKQYDALFKELLDFEAAHPQLKFDDSPTQRVGGAPVAGLKSVTHGEFMLSIDNAFTSEELKKRWDKWQKALGKTPRVILEPKIDGQAVSLLYTNGVLTGAVTRGDGATGDDIIHSARSMLGVPVKLEPPTTQPDLFEGTFVEIRGEAYIRDDDFKAVRALQTAAGETPSKHSRTAAVGALRKLDPSEVRRRRVRFTMHGLGTCSEKLVDKSWHRTKTQFRHYGMPAVRSLATAQLPFEDLSRMVDDARRVLVGSGIPIDGVVVKLESFEDQNVLGASSRAVNWAIAVKKDLYTGITNVGNLAIQVGKLGTLTPVCFLKPVEIDGTSVTKATLHNFDISDKFDIRVGDEVLVEKAGKIIPHILEVHKDKRKGKPRKFVRPTKCPMCGGAVKQDGVALKCTNTLGCKAQLEATILAAADRSRLDIDGLGPVLIENLIHAGLVKTFLDMWRLKDKRAELVKIAGVGTKTVDKLLAELEKAKTREPDKLLACLNIPGLGRTKAKLLINHFGGYQYIPDEPAKLTPILGKVGAAKLIAWMNTAANSQLIVDLLNLGFNLGKKINKPAKAAIGPLTGKKVCATGTFKNFTRESIHDAIVRAGGTVATSVSSKTAYLVVGADAGSKATNAEKLKVPRLTEKQFAELIK